MHYAIPLLLICLLSTHQTNAQKDSAGYIVENNLSTVIVSANKAKEKRIEAPVGMSILGPTLINDAKAQRIDYLLNKVSGVLMPSIGNEQHMMSIRQPISLKGLYLYLEDGLPIRTSGLFSNNALIEINTDPIHTIEIVKGPASAIYGAEAIGGVINFISSPSPLKNSIAISNQLNNNGFVKSAIQWTKKLKKTGWTFHGSQIGQKNGLLEYSDYNKTAISLKHQFVVNEKLSGYQSINYIHYFSQMTGTVDSLKFFQKNYSTLQTFTYRKLDVLRARQNLQFKWNENNTTFLNLLYRTNTMGQNPAYAIASTNNPTQFKGQINENHFDALVLDLQHIVFFSKTKSKLILGGYLDNTKQNLLANFINIKKDTVLNKFISYSSPFKDSIITDYSTALNNKAIYINLIQPFGKKIRLNAAIRYDQFNYDFNNLLKLGTPSSNNRFSNWAPKIGLTYNQKNIGFYGNMSQGFVPPQITEMYNSVRVPFLLPQQFINYEIGSWLGINKLYVEWSLYQIKGKNEIISVRQTDGVNLNQNTGQTNHYGIEYQIKYAVNALLQFNFNASNARHYYVNTILKGTDISNNEMVAAPRFFSNLTLSSAWSEALNTSIEWQHQSAYFMDEININRYPGFNVLNLRMSYDYKKHNFWLHCFNLTDQFYATMATKNFSVKGNNGYAYYLGDNRTITLGWKWNILP